MVSGMRYAYEALSTSTANRVLSELEQYKPLPHRTYSVK